MAAGYTGPSLTDKIITSEYEITDIPTKDVLFPHPAWPLVDGALLMSIRRSPVPDDLQTFVRPLCRPPRQTTKYVCTPCEEAACGELLRSLQLKMGGFLTLQSHLNSKIESCPSVVMYSDTVCLMPSGTYSARCLVGRILRDRSV